MSVHVYCDACRRLITGEVFHFEYPKHLDDSCVSRLCVDKEGVPVSYVKTKADLCSSCCNWVYGAAVTKMKQITKENT